MHMVMTKSHEKTAQADPWKDPKAEERRRILMQRPPSFVADIAYSFQLHAMWRALAWQDLIQRYRRSTLGIAWILFSFLLLIAVFVLVFGRSSAGRTPLEYSLYLAAGLLVWNYFSAIVTKGVAIFSGNAGWIRSTPAPFAVLAFRNVYANLLEAVVCVPVVIVFAAIVGVPISPNLLWIFLAIFLLLVNGISAGLLFGSIGAWSNDFAQLIPAIMRIAFFATPVFWDYETAGGSRLIMAIFNPMSHLIEIARAPILGGAPTQLNCIVALSFTITMAVLALIAFKYARPRLAAWV